MRLSHKLKALDYNNALNESTTGAPHTERDAIKENIVVTFTIQSALNSTLRNRQVLYRLNDTARRDTVQ